MSFAIKSSSCRWPNACVRFQIHSNVNATTRSVILSSVARWNALTNIHLWQVRPGEAPGGCVLFVHTTRRVACSSSVGRQGGVQEIKCDSTNNNNGRVQQISQMMHEIGHAIGLYHEHQRPDCNKFIRLDLRCVPSGSRRNFTVRSGGICLTEYDFPSLMHYPTNAFGTAEVPRTIFPRPVPRPPVIRGTTLSPLDIRGVNRIYPRRRGMLHFNFHNRLSSGHNRDWRWRGDGKVLGSGWHKQRLTFGLQGRESVLYGIYPDGQLYWYRHSQPSLGRPTWTHNRRCRVSGGWSRFANVVGGSHGVIYAIEHDGDLKWYRHLGYLDGTVRWHRNSDFQIDRRWNRFRSVVSAGYGTLYAVEQNGDLRLFRHGDTFNGRPMWLAGSNQVVSTGWDRFQLIVADGSPNGDGTFNYLYGVETNGAVRRFIHTINRDGTHSWQEVGGRTIRGGWNVYSRMISTGFRRFYGVVA